jgi:hypothetical protein
MLYSNIGLEQKQNLAGCGGCIPVTQEVEIGRIIFRNQTWQKVSKTPSQQKQRS